VYLPLGVDQIPLLPPEAGLNLNLGSYQSDEQGPSWFVSLSGLLSVTKGNVAGELRQERWGIKAFGDHVY
jgi:hypothetical protein